MLSDSSKQVAIAESQRLRDLGYYTHAANNLKDLLAEYNGSDLEITIILADTLASQGYWQEARETHASFFKRSENIRTTAGNWIYPAQLLYCLFDTVCSGEQEHALKAAASIYAEFEQSDGLSHSVPDISVLTVTFYSTLLHLAHNYGISGKFEQETLDSLLETRIKPDFSVLLNCRQYRNALRLATAYRLFSNRPDNLCLLQELRNYLDTPELVKALAAFEITKDLEQLGSYAQCDAIYVDEVSPILDRLGHSHAATDIALSQKCRDNVQGDEADIWALLLEYRAFDYPTGLFKSLKKGLRKVERSNNTSRQDSIWALGKNLVSGAQWSLASWELSSLHLAHLSRHDASADACLKEGFRLYKSLQPTSLESLKATVASILGNEYLVRMDGDNAIKWGQLCETSMSKCSSRSHPDATLIILQGRLLRSSQYDDLKDIIIWARTAIETDIENGYPEKAAAKCQAFLSHIIQRSPMPSAESILITQEFHVKNEALKNRIQAQQPQPAAELWEAALSLIREGKQRSDLVREEAALELLQKHHRIALHMGNISLVADNDRRTGILYCDMFEKLRDRGQPQKWLIDRAFELLFSANSSYVNHADLENQKECAYWLAKISFEKSPHEWSGEPEVLDRCRIAEDVYHKRRLQIERHGGSDTLADRGLLLEIYRFAIQTCQASGDQEMAAAWQEKYGLAVA